MGFFAKKPKPKCFTQDELVANKINGSMKLVQSKLSKEEIGEHLVDVRTRIKDFWNFGLPFGLDDQRISTITIAICQTIGLATAQRFKKSKSYKECLEIGNGFAVLELSNVLDPENNFPSEVHSFIFGLIPIKAIEEQIEHPIRICWEGDENRAVMLVRGLEILATNKLSDEETTKMMQTVVSLRDQNI